MLCACYGDNSGLDDGAYETRVKSEWVKIRVWSAFERRRWFILRASERSASLACYADDQGRRLLGTLPVPSLDLVGDAELALKLCRRDSHPREVVWTLRFDSLSQKLAWWKALRDARRGRSPPPKHVPGGRPQVVGGSGDDDWQTVNDDDARSLKRGHAVTSSTRAAVSGESPTVGVEDEDDDVSADDSQNGELLGRRGSETLPTERGVVWESHGMCVVEDADGRVGVEPRMLYTVKVAYSRLLRAFIRPPRADYDVTALGPVTFHFRGRSYVRKDKQTRNVRGRCVQYSVWREVVVVKPKKKHKRRAPEGVQLDLNDDDVRRDDDRDDVESQADKRASIQSVGDFDLPGGRSTSTMIERGSFLQQQQPSRRRLHADAGGDDDAQDDDDEPLTKRSVLDEDDHAGDDDDHAADDDDDDEKKRSFSSSKKKHSFSSSKKPSFSSNAEPTDLLTGSPKDDLRRGEESSPKEEDAASSVGRPTTPTDAPTQRNSRKRTPETLPPETLPPETLPERCSGYSSAASSYSEASATPPKPVAPRATIVYLHGNASSRVEGIAQLALSLALGPGVQFIALDCCGSGQSEGEFVSLGLKEQEDVVAVLDAERAVVGSLGRVALWGRSMGAVTALLVAATRVPDASAIVCDSAYSSLRDLSLDVARRGAAQLPSFLAKSALRWIRDSVAKRADFDIYDVDAARHAPDCVVPGFFICAADDAFVEPKHTSTLHDLLAADSKELCVCPGTHNSTRPKDAFDRVEAFLRTHLQLPKASPSQEPFATGLDAELAPLLPEARRADRPNFAALAPWTIENLLSARKRADDYEHIANNPDTPATPRWLVEDADHEQRVDKVDQMQASTLQAAANLI